MYMLGVLIMLVEMAMMLVIKKVLMYQEELVYRGKLNGNIDLIIGGVV